MGKDVVVVDINRYEMLLEANSRFKIVREWISAQQKGPSKYVDVAQLNIIVGLKEEGE